jgi:DNA-binding transcriptional ArsR family regulator
VAGARRPRASPAQLDAYEAIFSALAHPARRQILMTLNFEGGEMTAGAIAALFAHSWPTTTRHLQVLADAGLLQQEPRGRARIYRIDTGRLALARDWIVWFFKIPG